MRQRRDRHEPIAVRRIAYTKAQRDGRIAHERDALRELVDYLAFEVDLLIYEVEELQRKKAQESEGDSC